MDRDTYALRFKERGCMKKKSGWMIPLIVSMSLLAACASVPGQPADHGQEENLPELKIGCDLYAPYFYVGEDGNYTGVDREIASEACRRLGYRPVFKEIIWGEHNRLLEDGEVDCIWCSFSMNDRENLYHWAGPYLYSPEVVVVPADSKIQSLEDLRGKTIAVQVDSKAEEYFLKRFDKSGEGVRRVVSYSRLNDAFVAFGKGYADAIVGHEMALNMYTAENSDLYRYLDTPLLMARLGVAFDRKKDSRLAEELTQTLREMNEDGTIPQIAEKYGLSEEWTLGVRDHEQ